MNVHSEVETAKTLITNKNYDEAESLLTIIIDFLEKQESGLERNKQLSEAYNSMGVILYKKVEFSKAVSFYNKSIKSRSSFASAYYNRGLIHYRLGSFEAAKTDVEQAVILDPENSEFALGLQEVIGIIKNSLTPDFIQQIHESN